MANAKKAGKKAGKKGPEPADGAPAKVRRKGPGLLDRVTGLVVALFLVSAAVQHVVA